MSYEVLARKYRPQQFEDLIGQRPIAETLKNAIEMGKVSHAYLFAGPRGVGKTSAARILAKSLNCTRRTGAEPCGTCQNCMDIARGISLDVMEIDGASNRGIDEMRELKEKVNYSPIQSKYKIYIIDEVHMLTTPAFNALLKTLEEPPLHIIFILATTEAHLIPLTVLSRCQRFDFRRITIQEIVTQLEKICANEHVKADKEALFLLAKNSDGSMRDSQSALDQLIAYSENDINVDKVSRMFGLPLSDVYHDYLQFILKKDVEKGIEFLKKIYDQGMDLRLFIEGFISFLRNLFFIKNKIEDEEILEESTRTIERLKVQTQDLEGEVLDEMIKYLVAFLEHFKYTTQFKVLTELSFFNLMDISQKISLKFIYQFIKSFEEAEKPGTSVPLQDLKGKITVPGIGKGPALPAQPEEVTEKSEGKAEPRVMKDDLGDKSKFWPQFIKKVSEKAQSISAILSSGMLKEMNEDALVIAVKKKYQIDHLNAPSVLDTLRQVMKNSFNRDFKFKFELAEEEPVEPKEDLKDPRLDKVKTIFRATEKK